MGATKKIGLRKKLKSAKIYNRLAESAELYAAGRAGLYRDPELQTALEWNDSQIPSKPWAQRYHSGFSDAIAFLKESEQKALEEAAENEKKRQKELENAKQLAIEKAREARRLKWLLVAMAFLVVIAFATAIVAYRANQINFRLSNELREERDISRSNEQAALDNERRALEIGQIAEQRAIRLQASNFRIDSLFKELQNQLVATQESEDNARILAQIAETQRQNAEEAAEAESLAAQRALEESERANDAFTIANQRLIQSRGLLLTSKAREALDSGDSELGATLARQAYAFDLLNGQRDRGQVFGVIRSAVSALISESVVSRVIDHNGDDIRAVGFSSSNWIASGSEQGMIYLESPDNAYYILKGHNDWVRRVSFGQGGSVLGSSGRDGTIRLWQISDQSEPLEMIFPTDYEGMAPIAFDSEALSSIENSIVLRNRLQSTIEELSDRLGGRVIAVEYLGESGYIIAGIENGSLGIILDLSDAMLDIIFPGLQEGRIEDIAVNLENTKIAVSGGSNSIKLLPWPYLAQSRISELNGHGSVVNSIDFSPNGEMLASASSDGTLRLWDLSGTNKGTIILDGHTSWVRDVAFGPDGKSIVSGSADGTTRVWQIDEAYLVDQLCGLEPAELTEEQWLEFVEADISYEIYYQSCTD